MLNLTLSSWCGSLQPDIAHSIGVSRQLSQRGIRWPVSHNRIASSWCRSIEFAWFFVIRWQVTSFQMIAGSSLIFFQCTGNKFCLWAVLLTFWFQADFKREHSASFYKQGSQLPSSRLFLLTTKKLWLCSPWSRVGHALRLIFFPIDQNLTGEFIRKCKQLLETCLLILFLTRSTKWNTAAIKILLIFTAGLFIEFLVEKRATCQSHRKSSFSKFTDSSVVLCG